MPRKSSSTSAPTAEIETLRAGDVDIAPGRVRQFPAGWSGTVPKAMADDIAAKGAASRAADKAAPDAEGSVEE